MSDGGITLEMILNDLRFTAGMLKAAGSQKQFTSEVDRTKRQSAQAEKELDRMADTVKKMTATPLEKYNKELAQLDKLAKAGKITVEQQTRAIAMHRAELDRATNATQKLGAATDKTGRFGAQSALQMAESMGVVTTATGAATKAVDLLKQAWQRADQQAQRATDTMKSLFEVRGETMQVAGAGQGQKLIDRANDAAASGTANQLESQTVLNTLIGAGAENEFEKVIEADKWGADALSSAQMISKARGVYQDTEPDLTGEQLMNMAAAAARQGNLSYADVARSVSAASEGAPIFGATSTETLGLLSVMGEKFGGAERAAARSTEFMSKLGQHERFRDRELTVMQAVDELQAASVEDRADVLGRDQGANAYYAYAIQAKGRIRDRVAAVDEARRLSGTGQSQIALMEAETRASPTQMAAVKMITAENAKTVAEERALGIPQAEKNAALDNLDAKNLQRGTNWLSRFTSATGAYVATKLGASPATATRVGEISRGTIDVSGALSRQKKREEEKREEESAARLQIEAAHAQKEAADSMKATAAAMKAMRHGPMQAEALQPIN